MAKKKINITIDEELLERLEEDNVSNQINEAVKKYLAISDVVNSESKTQEKIIKIETIISL